MAAAKDIYSFLKGVAANNNREWFLAHKAEYMEAKEVFERMVQKLINRIAEFDPEVADVSVKSSVYRFYRDTRFSLDKTPYKLHFGAYINPYGRKSIHCGYYLHLQPGESLIGGGAYCLTPDSMKAVRESIVYEAQEFRKIIEKKEFKDLFPVIGGERMKAMPRGFSRTLENAEYLKCKDFSVVSPIEDSLFSERDWVDVVAEKFRVMKPYNDFLNATIDDYI